MKKDHIEHWSEGYDARVAGRFRSSNPYSTRANGGRAWRDGWDSADRSIQAGYLYSGNKRVTTKAARR